jgi:hypothetical protein
MNALATKFRESAREKSDLADKIMAETSFAADPKNQITVVVGKVVAHMLVALADVLEFQDGARQIDGKAERRRQSLEKNDAIRRAAAAGNWDEFDQLVAGFGDPGLRHSPGSDGSQ